MAWKSLFSLSRRETYRYKPPLIERVASDQCSVRCHVDAATSSSSSTHRSQATRIASHRKARIPSTQDHGGSRRFLPRSQVVSRTRLARRSGTAATALPGRVARQQIPMAAKMGCRDVAAFGPFGCLNGNRPVRFHCRRFAQLRAELLEKQLWHGKLSSIFREDGARL